jgi:hypothetical protein
LRPSSASDLAAAALACLASGDLAESVELARRALALERGFTGMWALAAGLDGLARYAEADTLWQDLDAMTIPQSLSSDRAVAYQVARARAHLARGHLRAATLLLESARAGHDIANADDVLAHQLNAATVELARVRLWTSSEREGRELAESVVDFYRGPGAETHAMRLEAELVWAEAAVALALFELRPDTSKWPEAEKTV